LAQGSGDDRETEACIADFLEGRPDAVRRVAHWARSVARHHAWGFEGPEDIVQATLLALVRNLRDGRFLGGNLQAYVRRIALNLCVSSYRRKRRRPQEVSLESEEGGELPSKEGLDPRQRFFLRRVLGGLDEECRRLILQAYLEGKSRKEMADGAGLSQGTLNVRVFRCLRKARALAGA